MRVIQREFWWIQPGVEKWSVTTATRHSGKPANCILPGGAKNLHRTYGIPCFAVGTTCTAIQGKSRDTIHSATHLRSALLGRAGRNSVATFSDEDCRSLPGCRATCVAERPLAHLDASYRAMLPRRVPSGNRLEPGCSNGSGRCLSPAQLDQRSIPGERLFMTLSGGYY